MIRVKNDKFEDITTLTYLYQCFAKAVQESLMYNSFDGTMDKDQESIYDFKDHAWRDIFSSFVTSCGVYLQQKNGTNEASMEFTKSLLVNFWFAKALKKNIAAGNKKRAEDAKKKANEVNRRSTRLRK